MASLGIAFQNIASQNKETPSPHKFGDRLMASLRLNETGKIADACWRAIPDHFPFIILDEFVVMPDHIHGIIFIKRSNDENTNGYSGKRRDAINGVSTIAAINGVSTVNGGIVPVEKNPMIRASLSTVIRWYKGRVTFEIHKSFNVAFSWQSRFYDHIIRNEIDLNNTRQYILNNPIKWELDKNKS